MDTTLEDNQATPEGTGKMRKADFLLLTILPKVHLYPTPEGQVYARIPVGDHQENVLLRSQAFKAWVNRQHLQETKRTVGKEVISDVIAALEGEALYGGTVAEDVHLRIAGHNGKIYLFLADQNHTVIEVDEFGWRISSNSPVNFVNSRGMLPLPMPEHGGTLDLFRKYVNVEEEELVLYMAFLTAALRPQGPYPILNISGEQGSAKSTATRTAKNLIDPTKSSTRVEPRTPTDMMIAANNEHMLAWDNLSHLKPWQSDMLCQIATGASMTKKQLYTDTDEIYIEVERPQILNGITDVATRPDLLERVVNLHLPTIPEWKRRTEAELEAGFEQDRAKMLGFLLTAVSTAIRNLPHVNLGKLGRMADFEKWGVAAETAWGVPEGSFLKAYRENQVEAQDMALDASPVAQAAVAMLKDYGSDCLKDQPQEVLKALEPYANPDGQIMGQSVFFNRPPDWPRSPRALTDALKRFAPVLRRLGIEYTPPKKSNGTRVMSLCQKTTSDRADSATG